MDLIIRNTPVFLSAEAEAELSDFVRAAIDRGALLEQLRETRLIVSAATEAMKEEQDGQLLHHPDQVPVTQLGSFVLKTVAERWSDHRDYSQKLVIASRFDSH